MVKKRACRACNLHRGSGAADTAGVLPPFRNNSKAATSLVMPPLPQPNPTTSAAPSRSLDLAVQVWSLIDSFSVFFFVQKIMDGTKTMDGREWGFLSWHDGLQGP